MELLKFRERFSTILRVNKAVTKNRSHDLYNSQVSLSEWTNPPDTVSVPP
jgi:hypothetical protein